MFYFRFSTFMGARGYTYHTPKIAMYNWNFQVFVSLDRKYIELWRRGAREGGRANVGLEGEHA